MKVPMPSPRGTNRAGLFLPPSWAARDPVAAYDAAEGLAAPEAESPAKQVLSKIRRVLAPKDLAELRDLLASEDFATDDPPDFAGKPRPGREPLPAMDGALRTGSFEDMFPSAKRIGFA